MNKFIRISFIILVCFFMSGIIAKFTYSDMIDRQDYESRNINELIVEFESRKTVKNGTKIKFKIYNNSKFTYLLTKARIKFENNLFKDNLEYNKNNTNLYIEMDNNSKLNSNLILNGILPNKDGYLEFIIPKGLSLNKKYFALDSTKMEYEGNFAEKVPIFTFLKIPVEQSKGIWSIKALN